jgi:hypothetical protein
MDQKSQKILTGVLWLKACWNVPTNPMPCQNFDIERRKAFISLFQKAQDSGELPKTVDTKALAKYFAGLPSALFVVNAAKSDYINVAMTVLPKSGETYSPPP